MNLRQSFPKIYNYHKTELGYFSEQSKPIDKLTQGKQADAVTTLQSKMIVTLAVLGLQ